MEWRSVLWNGCRFIRVRSEHERLRYALQTNLVLRQNLYVLRFLFVCKGVHGGLLVHRARFTAELLASLLLIPQGKTLLRRHLATHFNQLVGREVVQAKREMDTSSAYPPLIPVVKVKVSFVAIHSNQSS